MAGLDQSILTGLSRARSGGGSFPAQFSGLSYRAVSDGECTVLLGPAAQVLDRTGNFAAAAITMLCDCALSGAARSRAGRAATTPTVTLQIEYQSWPFPAGDIVCQSVFRGWLGKLAIASATLETAAGTRTRLGSACGRFLVQERTAGAGFSRYPWEEVSESPVSHPSRWPSSGRPCRASPATSSSPPCLSCSAGPQGKPLRTPRTV
jgi:hypothetical protein